MANDIGFPHSSVALIDANGRMTREGLQFLQALWNRTPISGYALQADMDAAEAAIAAAEADIAAAEANITLVQSSVTTLTAEVDTLQAQMVTAQADINVLEAQAAARNHIKFQLSCSDLTTALSAATSVAYFRATRAFTITAVRASLLTASSSGVVTVDINVNGSTILSTKLTIDQSETTSVTAATPAVISSATVADDDAFTIDIDGGGTGAKGLIVSIIGAMA